jgi:hypothetical protein
MVHTVCSGSLVVADVGKTQRNVNDHDEENDSKKRSPLVGGRLLNTLFSKVTLT